MKELLDRSGIRTQLSALDLPFPDSNRGYSPVQMVESFWVSIWVGASRFAHSGWLRYDKVLQEIFQWKRVPSQSTFSRFFHKFSQRRNTEVFVGLNRWFFEQLKLETITLDLDNSVITRYGRQEGSRRGFNPKKPGRPSPHPLMAFLPQTRMVINAWLRPGDTASSTQVESFLEETFQILPSGRVGLVRADSGFYNDRTLSYFEDKALSYIVAARLTVPLQWELSESKPWIEIARGIQVCTFYYQAQGWKHSRRMVAVRQQIEKRPALRARS